MPAKFQNWIVVVRFLHKLQLGQQLLVNATTLLLATFDSFECFTLSQIPTRTQMQRGQYFKSVRGTLRSTAACVCHPLYRAIPAFEILSYTLTLKPNSGGLPINNRSQ